MVEGQCTMYNVELKKKQKKQKENRYFNSQSRTFNLFIPLISPLP